MGPELGPGLRVHWTGLGPGLEPGLDPLPLGARPGAPLGGRDGGRREGAGGGDHQGGPGPPVTARSRQGGHAGEIEETGQKEEGGEFMKARNCLL